MPPVDVVYHCGAVPVATKLATVAPEQNVCTEAVGAAVVFTVTNCVIPPVIVLQGAESFLRTQYVVFDVNPSVV